MMSIWFEKKNVLENDQKNFDFSANIFTDFVS